jgi:RNase P/RNase MRP subunit p30
VGDHHDAASLNKKKSYHDLMVPIPGDKDKALRQLKVQKMLDRLEFLGYSSVALVHQVFGKPKGAIPVDQIFEPYEQEGAVGSGKNKRTRKRSIQIYRRLHAVVENSSDMAYFNDPKMMEMYDLVSVAPSTESIFYAACSSMVDIITLDYSRGGGLPFKIRSSHVQATVEHNIAMEIPYTPSIFHLPHRKALIQTVRALQSSSVGKKVNLIVNSGSLDANAMALRSPGDMANVLETVANLDPTLARGSQCVAAEWVLEEARKRRVGDTVKTCVLQARIGISNDDEEVEETKPQLEKSMVPLVETSSVVGMDEEDDGLVDGEKESTIHQEDGFITL